MGDQAGDSEAGRDERVAAGEPGGGSGVGLVDGVEESSQTGEGLVKFETAEAFEKAVR